MDQTFKMGANEFLLNIKRRIQNELARPIGMDRWVLVVIITVFVLFGAFMGYMLGYSNCERNLESSVAQIRFEAIEEYKQALEDQRAAESAERTMQLMDEGAKRKHQITRLAQLFEKARPFNFDYFDLVTYGICVYNRELHPEFGGTFDELLDQPGQWLAYDATESDISVVSDYYKIAEKVVDLCYNTEARPVSQRFAWIEIIDGQLFLKDTFAVTPTTHYWRYSE